MLKRYLFIILTTFAVLFLMRHVSNLSEKAVTVDAVTVSRKDIYDSIIARGTIKEANSRKIYTPYVKVKNLNVAVGDAVKAGDVLFETEKIAPVGSRSLTDRLLDSGAAAEGILSVFSEYGVSDILNEYEAPENVISEPVVKSPIDGIITELNVAEGEYYTGLTAAATVSDLKNIYAKVNIPELYIGRIEEDMRAEITGEAFGEVAFSGNVNKILPVARQTAALSGGGETYIEAVICFDNPDDRLKPGLSVTAKIITDRVKDAMTLPYDCVRQDKNNREYVYIVKNDRAYKAYVETGYELETETQVKNGINHSDTVIVNPPDDLKPGDKVFVNRS